MLILKFDQVLALLSLLRSIGIDFRVEPHVSALVIRLIVLIALPHGDSKLELASLRGVHEGAVFRSRVVLNLEVSGELIVLILEFMGLLFGPTVLV